MKTRLIISLSVTALIILILIQFLIVNKVYKLKKTEFDLTKREYIDRALFDLETRFYTSGFDSVYHIVNNLSLHILDDIDTLVPEKEYPDFKMWIYQTIKNTVYDNELLSPFLKDYLKQQGLDSDFQSGFIIRELQILNFNNEFNVIDEIINKLIEDSETEVNNAIKVNTNVYEGDYFRINFDFYIDFTHKQRIVLREMAGILLFAIISIFIAGFVFIYTYNNLLKEKKISDLKTDFINNMTHELKTPLSTIAVASDSLAYENIINDKLKILDISKLIGKQNKHLNKLINHILEISMWEREQFKLDKKEIKILPFLKEKVDAFRVKHQNGEIIINEEYNFTSIALAIDEFQITTAINNLFNNAVKYSTEIPEIRISSYVDKELIIKISDNGIGISYEEQKQIFDKFYRVNRGDIHKVKGLGLGLYYVKKIIEAHKGRITVNSKPGKGSTFTIFLPL